VLVLSSVFLRIVFVCIDINNLQIIVCFTECLMNCTFVLVVCHDSIVYHSAF